jgi:hypothetical protein
VQTLPSSQVIAVPTHTPVALQVSFCVQELPSLQATPGVGVWTQPVEGLHESAVQAFPSSQTMAVPTHWPAWQESACVQRLLSSQVVPSGFAGLEQSPVAGSQLPASWH